MKKILLSFAVIFLYSASFAQSIKESFIDDFTGNKVIKTSWVSVMSYMTDSYIRLTQINTSTIIDFKLCIGGVFSIKEGAELMFKMDNEKIAKFRCLEYAITSMGGGSVGLFGSQAQGLMARYVPADSTSLPLLSTNNVKKIRIYTTDGYVDQNVSEGESNSIREAFFILNEEYKEFDEIHSKKK
jgi:hypothetical protein